MAASLELPSGAMRVSLSVARSATAFELTRRFPGFTLSAPAAALRPLRCAAIIRMRAVIRFRVERRQPPRLLNLAELVELYGYSKRWWRYQMGRWSAFSLLGASSQIRGGRGLAMAGWAVCPERAVARVSDEWRNLIRTALVSAFSLWSRAACRSCPPACGCNA
jgi:hypothetical protein